jgi:hypothetical protein
VDTKRATVLKNLAPLTVPADSPIRRLYLLALIDATNHPQIHGHPTICQTAAQIAPVLTKEMMATPTISLPMIGLMQTLVPQRGNDSPDMGAPAPPCCNAWRKWRRRSGRRCCVESISEL